MPEITRFLSPADLARGGPSQGPALLGVVIDHTASFEDDILMGNDGPGLDWSLSAETIDLMQAIDDNMRNDSIRGQSFVLD